MRKTAGDPRHSEYLVIGAGPAGLQMAYQLQKSGRDYLVLEAGDSAGSFFKKFPRHRKLISVNKVSTGCSDPEVNLRWDWNSLLSDDPGMVFGRFSKSYFPPADQLVDYLNQFVRRFDLQIRFGTRIERISKGERFTVTAAGGETFTCDRLIVATGVSLPQVPPIPGIELAEKYVDVSIDPEDFRNQRVLVIGKGNSGFETADNLVETTAAIHMASPNPIRLAWKTHYVGHVRAINNNLLDTYQLKSQNTILDCEIAGIRREGGRLVVGIVYTHAGGQSLDIVVDRVIACTGFRFDASIFDDSCRPELAIKGKVPAVNSQWESINVPDLFFIGTLMQARDYHKSFSAFIHGFRYNVRSLGHMLDQRYHGQPWPAVAVEPETEVVAELLMDRIHGNSALFQQPEFFCDALGFPAGGGSPLFFREVPVDYLHEGRLGDLAQYYTLTLEYGHDEHFDPFNIRREPTRGDLSAFIHPVIRRFSDGEMTAEYHIPEDLENNWRQEMYVRPFLDFLAADLPNARAGAAPGMAVASPMPKDGQLGQAG